MCQVWLDPALSTLFSSVLASFAGRPSLLDGKMAFSRSMILSDPSVDAIRKKISLTITPVEILGLDLHDPNHITPTTLKPLSPQTTEAENGGKACCQKGGMETGQTESQMVIRE